MEEWDGISTSPFRHQEWMDRLQLQRTFDLLHLLFHDREENLEKTRWQQPAMFAMEHAMLDTSPPWVSTPCHGRPQFG